MQAIEVFIMHDKESIENIYIPYLLYITLLNAIV